MVCFHDINNRDHLSLKKQSNVMEDGSIDEMGAEIKKPT